MSRAAQAAGFPVDRNDRSKRGGRGAWLVDVGTGLGARDASDPACDRIGKVFLQKVGHSRHCWRLKDKRKSHVLAQRLAQSVDEAQSQKRVAAQIEKIIRQTDPIQAQHLRPDHGHLFFERRLRRHKTFGRLG